MQWAGLPTSIINQGNTHRPTTDQSHRCIPGTEVPSPQTTIASTELTKNVPADPPNSHPTPDPPGTEMKPFFTTLGRHSISEFSIPTSGEVNLSTGGIVSKAVHCEPLGDVNGIELQGTEVEVLKRLQRKNSEGLEMRMLTVPSAFKHSNSNHSPHVSLLSVYSE